jgi:23S rRNA (guanosine2251-2'-O)-methyltransferase
VIVYGRNPVRELLRGRRAHQLGRLWATSRAAREPWLAQAGPTVTTAAELEALCASDAHQGVAADAGPYCYAGSDELLATPEALIVVLDEVQDPQNLGAVCRSAESAGATGVVIPERRSADVTPAVCKASAGAVEHLAIARIGNVADFLRRARDAGCWSYGASARGGRPYDEIDYRGGVVLVLGAEGRGLRPLVARTCDELIVIPQRGQVGSLNVASAAAVLLYGVLHARKGLDRNP